MNKNLKRALKVGFEPPESIGEKEFLSKLNVPKLSYQDFFFSQICHIRKRVWCFSAVITMVIVVLVLCGSQVSFWNDSYHLAWITAALIPFLSLLTITELSRSASFGMAELELSCRYSLSHIVMARTAILGVSNLILLLILILAVGRETESSILSICLYMLVPYLLTCAASIFTLNHIGRHQSVYCCAVIACAVSLIGSILRESEQILFTEQYLWGWGVLCLFSIWLLVVQIKNFIRTTEDYRWNLLLTD